MNKLLYWFSVHTIILSFFMLLYIGYLLLYPFEPVVLHTNPFKIEKKEYKAGEYLTYTISYTKKMAVAPKIKFFLVDGVIFPLSEKGVSRPVGTRTNTQLLKLPDSMPSGKYLLQIDLEYQVNPLRTIYYSWQSEQFEIKEVAK